MTILRSCLAVLLLACTVTPLATGQAATDSLYACADKASDSERLACYDAAVAELRAAETTGEVVTFTTEEIVEARERTFGLEEDTVDSKLAAAGASLARTEPDDITAGLVSLDETAEGKLIVTLDNGQVWVQTDSSSVAVSRKSPPKSATVMKAALGSYRLKIGRARPFRVQRVD